MAVATYCLVALDCPDPDALAAFYQRILGGEVNRGSDDWFDLYVPGGARIAFQRAPDHRPPEWPRGDRNCYEGRRRDPRR